MIEAGDRILGKCGKSNGQNKYLCALTLNWHFNQNRFYPKNNNRSLKINPTPESWEKGREKHLPEASPTLKSLSSELS